MTSTDKTTQVSFCLMDQVRNSRLFTMPTVSKPGDMLKLTQRDTNLCVAIAAMRLISYAFLEFLVKNRKKDKTRQNLEQLRKEIISFPKVHIETHSNDHSSG